jgi:hypothetical protein
VNAAARTTCFLALLTVSGCASLDSETVWHLSRRIEALEAGKTNSVSAKAQTLNYIILYVPMVTGGHYPVKITQTAVNMFEGPKGEVYFTIPTPEQLRKAYGSPPSLAD